MSTARDMTDCQCRNEFGFRVGNGNAVNAPVDNSVNKALPWVAFSWFLSGGAIVGLIIWSIVAPSLIDSRVEARVAKAEANSELARKEASTAKDMVDIDRAKRKAIEELNHVR